MVDLGPKTYIFPGLIDLQTIHVRRAEPAGRHRSRRSSHSLGRPLGTEPYAKPLPVEQHDGSGARPSSGAIVGSPQTLLTNPAGLGLGSQVVEVRRGSARSWEVKPRWRVRPIRSPIGL